MTHKKLLRRIGITALGVAGTIGTSYVLQNQSIETAIFQTDIINLELAAPFDGTIMPIQKIPDWATLNDQERKLSYESLETAGKLISIPPYQPEKLVIATTDLQYGGSEYNNLVNQQITYSVPYLGNYELNGLEGAGSHPAVDIKIPLNTPVHAIGNGVVTKAKMDDGGFGNYVTIGHHNFPTLDDPEVKETIYSTYAHLSSLNLKEGDIVVKGQLIAYSGQSGIATTPHLHFQIDRLSAPFKPYWPFTSKDAKDAGYTFFQAINNGLGQKNAKFYTINSLKYVQKYISAVATAESVKESESNPPQNPDNKEPEVPPINSNDPQTESTSPTQNFSTFRILHDDFYIAGSPILISIKAIDENLEIIADPIIDSDLTIEAAPDFVKLGKNILKANDFVNGEAIFGLSAENSGEMTLTIKYKDQIIKTPPITILEKINQAEKVTIEHDGDFLLDEEEIIILKLLDKDGNIAVLTEQIPEMEVSLIQGIGEVLPEKLTKENFKNGVANLTFRSDALENAVIAITGSDLNVQSSQIKAKIFQDIEAGSPHAEALLTLKKRGVISGYPDKTFRPSNDISRVESLKIILQAAKTALSGPGTLNFPDTQSNVWYSRYVATAQSLEIVEGYEDGTFRPQNQVSRAEFFKILFRTFEINVDPVINEQPYEDVGILQWYAAYAQLVKKLNLLDSQNNLFEPGKPMTRAEIAEAIYRLIYIRENQLETFGREN